MSLNVDLQTQSDILQSDALALRVVKGLGLEQAPTLSPISVPVGSVIGLISRRGPPTRPTLRLKLLPAADVWCFQFFGPI